MSRKQVACPSLMSEMIQADPYTALNGSSGDLNTVGYWGESCWVLFLA